MCVGFVSAGPEAAVRESVAWRGGSGDAQPATTIMITLRISGVRERTRMNVCAASHPPGRQITHYGFRPDFCQASDPESKGMVERLVGYAKSDLMVPQQPFDDLTAANTQPPPGA